MLHLPSRVLMYFYAACRPTYTTNDFYAVRHLPTQIRLILYVSEGGIQVGKVSYDAKFICRLNAP
jgi:hypothetical protein